MSAGTTTKDAAATTLAALLPPAADGWVAAPDDGLYDAGTLFTLIDGGAEVYRALNVRHVLDRTYTRPDHADIVVDLFDMGADEDAFGAYHNDLREEASAAIGVESEHEGSALFFWKDRYYVAVVAMEETAAARAAVLALGRAIDGKIPRLGRKPRLATLLPTAGLVASEIYFFHLPESLTRLVPAAAPNPFGLHAGTRALLARYGRGGARPLTLLLVEYPAAAATTTARRRLESGKAAGDGGGVTLTVSGLRQHDRFLAAVLDGGDSAAVAQLLADAHQELRGGPKP